MQKKHVVESMVGLVELSDIDQLLVAGGCTCPPFGGDRLPDPFDRDRLPDPFDVSLPGPCDPLPGPYGDEFPES
jgi:hypothetical protein